jgi:SHS2 domain-containing protein
MSAPARGFTFVEGATSDLSFVARGATCEEALCAAAEALLAATVEDPARVGGSVTRTVRLEETELDLLLMGFLNELVYLRDAEGLLLRPRRLHLERVGEGGRLEAELVGEPWDPARHEAAGEVKAVTAHGLALRATPEGWEARATLDV